jgi:hypothetical protein
VKFVKKIVLLGLWFIILPILILMASNRYIYFIKNIDDLIIWSIFIIAFFSVFTITLLLGFKEKIDANKLNIEYDNDPAKKLLELAQKYHLDLEINDALKIYDEIKEKYPNSIYEKEAQIEINRIKGNRLQNKNQQDKDKPLEILRIKYAKGEITKKDFLNKKKDLEEN